MNIVANEARSIHLLWENLSVYSSSTKTRCVLDKASGYARAGCTVALMGTACSGKSTLLEVLGGRSGREGSVYDSRSGHIYLNRQHINDEHILVEQCGYVEQLTKLGRLSESITAREYLVFEVRSVINRSSFRFD